MRGVFGMLMAGGLVLGMASLASAAGFVECLRRLSGRDHDGVELRVLSRRLLAHPTDLGPAVLARDDVV